MSRILLFGATGMVGQGVLRECLADARVKEVLAIGRSPPAQVHPKLRVIAHGDLLNYETIQTSLGGYDACFFCLGVSSAGMTETAYRKITYDGTLAAAQALVRTNPAMTFIYVSGAGTDPTEQGRSMWARVKGATENALRALPFRAVYLFRPGFIQPLHGIKSKTALYQAVYTALTPFTPLLKRMFPNAILTTEEIGRAMLQVAHAGFRTVWLESKDIAEAARSYRTAG